MAADGPAPQVASSSTPAVTGSIVAAGEPPPSPASFGVQRTGGPGQTAALIEPTATAVVQRVDGAAPPPPVEGSGGHSDDELDELARALFGRIRNRLRREYIYEREAKGLTFDNS